MKCAVGVCPNTLEEYGSYDEQGAKVCVMCKATFLMIRGELLDVRL